jgi:drug/metabolite transporter (DMT)-like permease
MSFSNMHSKSVQTVTASVVIAFACLYFFWGSTYAAIRIGAQTMPTLLLAGPRFLISGVLMLIWCRFRGLRILLPARTMGMLLLLGILLLGTGHIGLVYAEKYISSGLCSLCYAVTPLFVALLESGLPNGEPISFRGWAGILLGIGGLAVMLAPSFHAGLGGNSVMLLSVAALFGGAFSWAAGSVVSRHVRLQVNILVAAAWQMLFGGIFNSALAIIAGDCKGYTPTLSAVLAVAYLVTFGSLVGYTAFIYLLEHVPVAKVMSYTYVNPVVAVLLGMILLHERPARSEYAGMAVIVVAVFLMTTAKVKNKIPDDDAEPLLKVAE